MLDCIIIFFSGGKDTWSKPENELWTPELIMEREGVSDVHNPNNYYEYQVCYY